MIYFAHLKLKLGLDSSEVKPFFLLLAARDKELFGEFEEYDIEKIEELQGEIMGSQVMVMASGTKAEIKRPMFELNERHHFIQEGFIGRKGSR